MSGMRAHVVGGVATALPASLPRPSWQPLLVVRQRSAGPPRLCSNRGGLDPRLEIAVPADQRPVNELSQLKEDPLYSWVRGGQEPGVPPWLGSSCPAALQADQVEQPGGAAQRRP